MTPFLTALPQGGVGIVSEQGRLKKISSWWEPARNWEGRWWWHPDEGGSAWVQAGMLQLGPLVVSSGLEGERTWSAGTELSSGHWGLGIEGESAGFWAVQRPADFEAGIQWKGVLGPWTFAGGTDRTWSLGVPEPMAAAWFDRGRGGVSLKTGGWSAGVESTAQLAAGAPLKWSWRTRASWEDGPWIFRGKYAADPWQASLEAGWAGWVLGWENEFGRPLSRWKGGWQGKGHGIQAVAPSLAWTAGGEVLWNRGEWVGTASGSLSGPWERGRWSAGWEGAVKPQSFSHTMSTGWKEPTFEVSASWKVQKLVLGWIGPGEVFLLDLKWLF